MPVKMGKKAVVRTLAGVAALSTSVLAWRAIYTLIGPEH